jgi:transposase
MNWGGVVIVARYKTDQRATLQLLSGSLDLLLPEDSVARAIWAGLERLDFEAFDTLYKNDATGRSALNPRCLTGVWMLGMLRGVTSSVRLASLCEQDVEFRWLVGDAPVEKSTLCDFRKNHQAALVSLSAQVLSALGQNGLLPGEHMGVDGTIVRAAASRHCVKKRKKLESHRKHLEEILKTKLSQADGEGGPEEVKALERRRERLSRALAQMTSRGLTQESEQLTVTEPDAGLKRQKDGSFAPGYNAQVVTDLDSGVIVSAQVVDAGGDGGQLQPQLERAKEVLEELRESPRGEGIQSITADGAYHDTLQLDAIEKRNIQCFVPEDRTINRLAPGVSPEYQADRFVYDERADTMICPQGQRLKWRKLNDSKTAAVYQAPSKACRSCPAQSQCCPTSQSGRYVNRSLYTETLDTVAKRLDTDEGRRQRHARWVVGEGVFARLNGLLHWKRNRMWHRAGAEAELLWRQFTHNLMLLTGSWKPMIPAKETR